MLLHIGVEFNGHKLYYEITRPHDIHSTISICEVRKIFERRVRAIIRDSQLSFVDRAHFFILDEVDVKPNMTFSKSRDIKSVIESAFDYFSLELASAG